MSRAAEDTRSSRRRFLKGVVVASGAVGAGLVAGTGVASVAHSDDANSVDEQPSRKGYHETSHIRTYYDLARF